jgi:predicted nucleic acid-binding protein
MSSAVYKRHRAGELPASDAHSLLDQAIRLPIRLVSPPGLPRRAFEIATEFRMKWIYDAFYVALAEIIGCDLWTADERLHEMVHDAYPNVRLLTEFEATP